MARSPSDFVSRRALGVDASGIRKVFDLAAKMKDPINLSIGLPDFDVPDIAKNAAIEAIRGGNNRYTQTQGIAPINPGDEALFLDPYFVMYKHLLTLAGGTPAAVDSYPDFRFHTDRVERAITPKTKVLILNSPSNPTGVVMSEAEICSAV